MKKCGYMEIVKRCTSAVAWEKFRFGAYDNRCLRIAIVTVLFFVLSIYLMKRKLIK